MKHKLIQTSLEKKIRVRAKRDFFYACLAVLVMTLASITTGIELFERMYIFSRQHEQWELDESLLITVWVGIVGVFYTYRRMQDLRYLLDDAADKAFFDQVSLLPNRTYSLECLTQMIHRAERAHRQIAVIFIDLNNFKMVNDTYGHTKGDLLLQAVGERLRASIRKGDIVGRLGGDEFLVLIELADREELAPVLERIKSMQDESYCLDENELFLRFSAGVAIYPHDGDNVTDLLKASDIAMYNSKAAGAGHIQFYTPGMAEELYTRYRLESELKHAIERNEFYIEYQPQISLEDNRVIGYEAFLRWKHAGEVVPAAQFIQVAEDTGYIEEIGLWSLNQALDEATLFLHPDQSLAVNITPRQFRHIDFVNQIQNCISAHGLAPDQLVLEVTESALISETFDITCQKLRALRQMGLSIAIDDFGMGYSSLGRLKELSVNCLKIDSLFTQSLTNTELDRDLVSILILLAKNLNLSVLAEGVESREQLDILRQMGCHQGQGFYIGKPMPLEQLSDFAVFNVMLERHH
jgi:diguanylate cyclase (GGDEF)-like protein